jgi:acyl-CoA thioester hydrolase
MGRLDWITKIGISYKNMESKGILLPVVFLKTNYLKPAYYDDELTIETSLLEKPTAKIKFGYKIYNENKDIITEGITHLAFMNKQSGKPQRCPRNLMDKIQINCYNM